MAKKAKNRPAIGAKTLDKNQHYTTSTIGKTRHKTPEGFLLCMDVAIARTGDMLYGAGEVPVDDDAGLITISRGESDLFRPETLASFEGKSVTNDHPDDWVGPDNWRDVSVGIVQNVRRGTGAENQLLFADMLITDKAAIEAVQGGKVEVSCGYDADYEQTAKGRGIQREIIGNHVALVEKGRCGSQCSIGDSQMAGKPKTQKNGGLLAILFGQRKTLDQEIEKIVSGEKPDPTEDEDEDEDEGKEGKTGDAVLKLLRTMDKENKRRFAAIEKRFADAEGKTDDDDDEDDDDDGKTGDDDDGEKADKKSSEDEEKYTGDSLQEIRSRAAILAPDYRMPTLDAKAKDIAGRAKDCKCKALDDAYKTASGKEAIDVFLAGQSADFKRLPRSTLDAVFFGASQLMKAQNNAGGQRSGVSTRDFGRQPVTPQSINDANRQYWADKKG